MHKSDCTGLNVPTASFTENCSMTYTPPSMIGVFIPFHMLWYANAWTWLFYKQIANVMENRYVDEFVIFIVSRRLFYYETYIIIKKDQIVSFQWTIFRAYAGPHPRDSNLNFPIRGRLIKLLETMENSGLRCWFTEKNIQNLLGIHNKGNKRRDDDLRVLV